MATATKDENKSAFLRDLFQKNPNLKAADATEAWQKAGHDGAIGSSLFYNIKRESRDAKEESSPKLTAVPRKRKATSAKTPKAKPDSKPAGEPIEETVPRTTTARAGSSQRERVLDRVEDGIDDLIIELKRLGDMDDALESLRKVRRVVVRSHMG